MRFHSLISECTFFDALLDPQIIMPKISRELTALQVKNIKEEGLHAVGGVPGLLLKVSKSAGDKPSRSWVFRARVNGRRIKVGLGSFLSVGLSEARQLAREQRSLVEQGLNPVVVRRDLRRARVKANDKTKTFKECASIYLEHRLKSLSNDKHKRQWITTLETYVYPIIGDRPVADISIDEVKDLLEQKTKSREGEVGSFWEIKTETASRVQGRMYDIFSFAITKGFRDKANPAEWRGRLSTLLPPAAKIKDVKHHKAIPYSKAPHFLSALLRRDSNVARALAFLLLTSVRSGSVRRAEWREIDFKEKVWTIPKSHEKTGHEHRVPLSKGAIKLLRSIPKIRGCDLIFPNPSLGVLSDAPLSKLMREMRSRGEINYEGVPHGCRAAFRTWAADKTSYSDEIRKAASGHSIGDAVKTAYQRGDLLEKRRHLMEDWSDYLLRGRKK